MKCDVCQKDRKGLVHTDRDGKRMMVCPECLKDEKETDVCRCKETVGKSPSEVLKLIVKDMFSQKK